MIRSIGISTPAHERCRIEATGEARRHRRQPHSPEAAHNQWSCAWTACSLCDARNDPQSNLHAYTTTRGVCLKPDRTNDRVTRGCATARQMCVRAKPSLRATTCRDPRQLGRRRGHYGNGRAPPAKLQCPRRISDTVAQCTYTVITTPGGRLKQLLKSRASYSSGCTAVQVYSVKAPAAKP